MMKRLVPYAGAEQRAARKPRNTPARSTPTGVDERLISEILRARREIKELQAEIDALQRILRKVREDRGAIT